MANSWKLFEEGYHYDTIEAETVEDALAEAESNVDPSSYPELERTIWIRVRVVCEATDEEDSSKVQVDPPEPKCKAGEEHDWCSPHAVVGGLEENPGVWGHGGGVIINECCSKCGCKRVTDTWAQDRETGEQGLESVAYEAGFYCDDPDWQELNAEQAA